MVPSSFLLCLTFLVLLSISTLAEIFPVHSSKIYERLSLSAPNISSLSIPVDPRFSTEGALSNVELNKTSCLMRTLQFTGDLAGKDWSSTVPTLQCPLPREYPGVVIIGGPEIPGTAIPISWLIWGLTTALSYLIEMDRYVESNFELMYDDRLVGTITFHRILTLPALASPSLITAQRVNSSQMLPAPTDTVLSSEALSVTEDVTLHITPLDGSHSLNPDHIWLTFLLAIETMAFNDASSRMKLLTTGTNPPATVAMRIDQGKGQGMPRQSPPFLYYSTVITAVRLLAEWMVQTDGGFREVQFVIASSGTSVGAGIVRSIGRPGSLDAILSIS